MCKVESLNDLVKGNVLYAVDTIYISEHAFNRIKERVGLNRRSTMRMIHKVYDQGIRGEKVKGYINIWLKKKRRSSFQNEEVVLYGKFAYIFKNKILITVIPVPNRSSCIKMAG